jgi:hypothetical protein
MNNLSVYEISQGRFAIGRRDEMAYAVVERILTAEGRGRPRYRGVRGRRPMINASAKRVTPCSKLLKSELIRVAGARN